MKMKKELKKELLLAGVLATVYIVMLSFVWIVQTKSAETRLDRLMESCIASAIDSVDYNVEPEALRVARILVGEWGSSDVAAKADLNAALERYDCEEINIVGPSNIIVAAANPIYIGFDMASGPYTAEFNALNSGERSHVTQRFRKSKCGRSQSKGGLGLWLKYVGLPFPHGGYIQVGDSYRDFRVRFRRELENLMENTNAGANGHYLLVDRENGTILSGFKPEWADRPLTDSGVDAKTFANDETMMRMAVFGVDSYVRRVRLVFAEMDVYVVIPVSDIMAERNISVIAAAIALGIVLLVGGLLFGKVLRQHERIEAFHARETERIEKDMAMAKAIQTNAIPSRFPPYPNLSRKIDLYARMITAREVGGDFYDFYFVAPNKLALVIADVSGKGIPAALFMMRAKATIQSYLKAGLSIVEAIEKTNHRLATGNDANMFVTAWIGCVDLATGVMEYVNAGHNPPLFLRANGSVEYLQAKSGLPLAAMDGARYNRQTLTLDSSDGLMLYTDGVTEATNPTEALYGEKRLLKTMDALLAGHDAMALTNGVLDDVNVFADGSEQADDITILCFRLLAKE